MIPQKELRNQVGEVLRRVEAGETLTVSGRPVADLSPAHRRITELHFGVPVAHDDEDERGRRTDRLAAVEATFDPLPITVEVSRARGRLTAAVAQRGG